VGGFWGWKSEHVKLPICDGLDVEMEEEARQKRLSGLNEQTEDERDNEQKMRWLEFMG
jgi:hypothetical protein